VTSLASDRRGAVYVEFLIAVVPFLIFVLCAIQSALLEFANLATIRAASAAARSAVVVLDDDPRFYQGEARNSAQPGGARMDAIRRAASNVLAALPGASPASMATQLKITFPSSGSGRERASFGPDDMVTVRVGYLFPCIVPAARQIMCRGGTIEGATAQPGFSLMQVDATLPNQGARYSYGGGGQ